MIFFFLDTHTNLEKVIYSRIMTKIEMLHKQILIASDQHQTEIYTLPHKHDKGQPKFSSSKIYAVMRNRRKTKHSYIACKAHHLKCNVLRRIFSSVPEFIASPMGMDTNSHFTIYCRYFFVNFLLSG